MIDYVIFKLCFFVYERVTVGQEESFRGNEDTDFVVSEDAERNDDRPSIITCYF